MSHHFGVAFDRDGLTAEFILQPGVAPLGGGPLVVADRFSRREFDLLSAARIVIDQGDVAQALAVLAQVGAAIGRIHEVVKVGDATGADQREGNGGQAVVHRRARE